MPLKITLKNYRCFSDETPATLLLDCGFVAFVGINNSGKSSLLKFFYELRSIFATLSGDLDGLLNIVMGTKVGLSGVSEVFDLQQLFFNGNGRGIEVEIELVGLCAQPPSISVTRAQIFLDRTTTTWTANFFVGNASISSAFVRNDGNRSFHEGLLQAAGVREADFQQIRAACHEVARAYYVPSFRHITTFNPPTAAARSYYDINVGRPFIDMWDEFQAGNSGERRQRIDKLTNEIRELFLFNNLQINAATDNETLRLMVNGKPFSLHEVGSGLAQFILVFGNAAFREPSFILIDEPELSLHPSLQVKFLMKLAGYASKGVLFATHNLGLARSVAETIYSVTADNAGSNISELNQTPRLAELLGELNYEGYRPLGHEKVLLVEGKNDVKVFIEFLRMFGKDHEFVVIPIPDLKTKYSKDELQEITRICPKISAVIDSERAAPSNDVEDGRKIFAQHCKDLGIECHILERRATENYLSEQAIKAIFGDTFVELTPYEAFKDKSRWPKSENWKIVRKMDRSEIEGNDLGEFLKKI